MKTLFVKTLALSLLVSVSSYVHGSVEEGDLLKKELGLGSSSTSTADQEQSNDEECSLTKCQANKQIFQMSVHASLREDILLVSRHDATTNLIYLTGNILETAKERDQPTNIIYIYSYVGAGKTKQIWIDSMLSGGKAYTIRCNTPERRVLQTGKIRNSDGLPWVVTFECLLEYGNDLVELLENQYMAGKRIFYIDEAQFLSMTAGEVEKLIKFAKSKPEVRIVLIGLAKDSNEDYFAPVEALKDKIIMQEMINHGGWCVACGEREGLTSERIDKKEGTDAWIHIKHADQQIAEEGASTVAFVPTCQTCKKTGALERPTAREGIDLFIKQGRHDQPANPNPPTLEDLLGSR